MLRMTKDKQEHSEHRQKKNNGKDVLKRKQLNIRHKKNCVSKIDKIYLTDTVRITFLFMHAAAK